MEGSDLHKVPDPMEPESSLQLYPRCLSWVVQSSSAPQSNMSQDSPRWDSVSHPGTRQRQFSSRGRKGHEEGGVQLASSTPFQKVKEKSSKESKIVWKKNISRVYSVHILIYF